MEADRQTDGESGGSAEHGDSEEAREPLTVPRDHVRNIITTNSTAAAAAAV